jgi:hypothetical protein
MFDACLELTTVFRFNKFPIATYCHYRFLRRRKQTQINCQSLTPVEVDDPREMHVSESNANEAKSFPSACYAAVPRKI